MVACFYDGILSELVIDALFCVFPPFKLMRVLMVLCSLEDFVLIFNVSLKANQFSVCFSSFLVFICLWSSCI